jgi:hypothetical protein
MLFFEAAEIEVGKDVAQQNQSPIGILLQHVQRLARPAHVGAEVQVREDQRVELRLFGRRIHPFIISKDCYELMNWVLRNRTG